MRIVHIIEATATGTLTMATTLANEQIKNGHSVQVIYSIREETPPDISRRFNSAVLLINIQMSKTKERVFSISMLRKTLKSLAPDVVIMHSSFAGFLGRMSCLGILKNANILYIPHCISLMRKDIGRIKYFAFLIFEWVASMRQSTNVACSQSELVVIRKAIPWRACAIIENAVENYVDIHQSIDKKKQRAETISIVTVGGIRTQKNPLIFAKIAELACSGEKNYQFIWVGDGNDHLKNALTKAGVKVLGWKSKDETMRIVAQSALYLSTSAWEGLPVSLIEAGYCETPVVASKCSGNIDVITDGENGLLFDTPCEALEKINEVLKNPILYDRLVKNSLDLVRKRFSMQRYLNQFESIMRNPPSNQ